MQTLLGVTKNKTHLARKSPTPSCGWLKVAPRAVCGARKRVDALTGDGLPFDDDLACGYALQRTGIVSPVAISDVGEAFVVTGLPRLCCAILLLVANDDI